MRKVDESRAANYIRKHSNYKKWLAFVLCLSLLTGTVTLYILNKPATAMTEEGAESLGVVLETASNADEEELIQQTLENKSVSNDNGDDDLFAGLNEDGDDNDENAGSNENGGENGDELNKSGDVEETKDGLVEEEAKEGEVKEGEEQEEAEEEDELTQDVVLTVSYVDEAGEAIADEKEIDIYDSIDLASEAPSIEGYTFKEATFKGDVITKVAVKKNADDIRYYEVTFDGDETKEIKKDATVVLTYIKDEEEVEVDASVTLTAKYVDKDGEDIQDSEEISFAKETSINKDNAPEIDGYFFMKAVYDGQEIVKITPVEAETEVEAEDSDNEEETTEETEEAKTVSVEGYEFTTADGDTVEITEDAEIEYTYLKANTQEEFTFINEEYTVTIKLSNPGVLPDGVELKVATVDKDTEGYNYDAYMDALNENAEKIAKANDEEADSDEARPVYNETNTILFDIAFMLDEIEYEPKEGTVTVSVEFNNKQISEDLEAENEEELTVVHLPLNSDVMEEVNATSDATGISSKDVNVEVYKESSVSLEDDVDVVTFETESFSITAIVKTVKGSAKTWYGYNDWSAEDIIQYLGNAKYFGVVAHDFEVRNHFEANVAVDNYDSNTNYVLFDYDQTNGGYINSDEFKKYKVTVEKKSTSTGTFEFALFEHELYIDANGNRVSTEIPNSRFTIEIDENTPKDSDGFYVKSYEINRDLPGLYVYELDANKKPVVGKFDNFTVTYQSEMNDSSNPLDALMSSYITNGHYSKDNLQLILHPNASVYYAASDEGWTKATKKSNSEIVISDTKYDVPKTFVGDMLNQVLSLSSALPYAATTDSVRVFNVRGKKDYKKEFREADTKKQWGWTTDGDVSDKSSAGFKINNDQILVINLDLTGCENYKLGRFVVNQIASNDAYNTYNSIASRVIINAVQRKTNGWDSEFEPYTGTLTLEDCMGTVIAPNAKIVNDGNLGSLIGKSVKIRNKELHKATFIGFKSASGNVVVTNVSSSVDYKVDIEATKLIEEGTATRNPDGTEDETFGFTLSKYDTNSKSWSDVYIDITNDKEKVKKTIEAGKLGMKPKDDEGNFNVYYFKLFENPVSADSKFSKDDKIILIKITGKERTLLSRDDFICEYYLVNSNEVDAFEKAPEPFFTSEHGHQISKTEAVFKNKDKFELSLFKYIDNNGVPQDTYEFWVRMVEQTDKSKAPVEHGQGLASAVLNNNGINISFDVNPSDWGMRPGSDSSPNEYYFLIWEPGTKDTRNVGATDKIKLTDKGTIIAKVIYNADGSIEKHYYRTEDQTLVGEYSKRIKVLDMDLGDEVTGEDVAFHNLTTKPVSIKVIKEWDGLIGSNKNSNDDDTKLTPDSIFDVTVKLACSKDGGQTWEYVEGGTYTFKTPDIYQSEQGANFEGDMGPDYPEPWTGLSYPHEFKNLNADYLYKVEEWYGELYLGECSQDKGVYKINQATVNGYKLQEVDVNDRIEGEITFTLHNTPYLQIQKYWRIYSATDPIAYEDTAGFSSVFVKLYRSYQDDKTPVDITKEVSGNDVIELSYGNKWFAEFPVPRKMDDSTDADHVRQCVYTIVECKEDGTLIDPTPYVLYGSIRRGNSTRVEVEGNDYTKYAMKGFHDKTQPDQIEHHKAFVQGNNYPEIILTVTNVVGSNVLPSAGGIGDIPYLATGLGTAVAGLLGAGVYSRKKKKDDEE